MTEGGAFLMKDLVLFAAYLLKQDVVRMARTAKYRDLFTKVKQAVDCFNTSSQ